MCVCVCVCVCVCGGGRGRVGVGIHIYTYVYLFSHLRRSRGEVAALDVVFEFFHLVVSDVVHECDLRIQKNKIRR